MTDIYSIRYDELKATAMRKIGVSDDCGIWQMTQRSNFGIRDEQGRRVCIVVLINAKGVQIDATVTQADIANAHYHSVAV